MKNFYKITTLLLATFFAILGLVRHGNACSHQNQYTIGKHLAQKKKVLPNNQFEEEFIVLGKIYATY